MLVLKEFRETGQLAPLNKANAADTYKSLWLVLEDCANRNGDGFRYLSGPINDLRRLWDSDIHREHRTIFGMNCSVASGIASLGRRSRKIYLAWSIPKSPSRRKVLQQLLKRFDIVLTNDTITSKQLQEQLNVPEQKIVFVPYGVDTNYFCRREYPPESQTDVIVPGDAFRDESTVEFILAHTELRILRLTNRENIANRYRELEKQFPGRVSIAFQVPHAELPSLYSRAKSCLLPIAKSSEPAGLTCLLESLACGVPVFCNNLKTYQDYIVDGENGFSYTTSDDLVKRMKTLTPTKLLEMSENSRRMAIDCYSWTKLQKTWGDLIYPESRNVLSNSNPQNALNAT